MSMPDSDYFNKLLGQVLGNAILMILAIVLLLVFCVVLEIWLEWKAHGQRY